MPHATGPGPVEPEDADFDNVMRQMNGPFGEGGMSFDFLTRELEPGEKADDAIDYEDIDDDDLPEEEERTGGLATEDVAAVADDEQKGLFEAEDDLFGDREDQQAPGAMSLTTSLARDRPRLDQRRWIPLEICSSRKRRPSHRSQSSLLKRSRRNQSR